MKCGSWFMKIYYYASYTTSNGRTVMNDDVEENVRGLFYIKLPIFAWRVRKF